MRRPTGPIWTPSGRPGRRTHQNQIAALLQFTEAGEAVLRFQSADTRGLACTAYCYDVRLHGADGSVDTIVPKNEFLVGEAVGDG